MIVFVSLNCCAVILIMVSIADPTVPSGCWRDFAMYEAVVLFIWTLPWLSRHCASYSQVAGALAFTWAIACILVWVITAYELMRGPYYCKIDNIQSSGLV